MMVVDLASLGRASKCVVLQQLRHYELTVAIDLRCLWKRRS